eukprot:5411307-Amphidinium_carterae.1
MSVKDQSVFVSSRLPLCLDQQDQNAQVLMAKAARLFHPTDPSLSNPSNRLTIASACERGIAFVLDYAGNALTAEEAIGSLDKVDRAFQCGLSSKNEQKTAPRELFSAEPQLRAALTYFNNVMQQLSD